MEKKGNYSRLNLHAAIKKHINQSINQSNQYIKAIQLGPRCALQASNFINLNVRIKLPFAVLQILPRSESQTGHLF
uniref:Uncharacterized protein n=1 Tax=Anguilla anguilla TaxID=7936 RepID=A0A0E9QR28_ANGAN